MPNAAAIVADGTLGVSGLVQLGRGKLLLEAAPFSSAKRRLSAKKPRVSATWFCTMSPRASRSVSGVALVGGWCCTGRRQRSRARPTPSTSRRAGRLLRASTVPLADQMRLATGRVRSGQTAAVLHTAAHRLPNPRPRTSMPGVQPTVFLAISLMTLDSSLNGAAGTGAFTMI
jgi:hypothetical protein